MALGDGDERRQIRDVAIHTVMTFDDEQGMPIARTHLAEQPVSGCVVEMGERHTAGAREDRALDDAVVDQRVVDDDIVTPQQMPDHGDIGRMATNEDDTVFDAVQSRQGLFEFAMNRAFAGDRTARRDRGAVSIDRRLRCRSNLRMAVESDVVVRGEIDVVLAVDHCLRAGDALMHTEERIGDPEELCSFTDHTDLSKTFELRHRKPRDRVGARWRSTVTRASPPSQWGGPRALLQQPRLCLRRQPKQASPRRQWTIPPPPIWVPTFSRRRCLPLPR